MKNIYKLIIIINIILLISTIILWINLKKEYKPIDDNFVFLGDSITNGYNVNKYFKDYPVVKSGVNGYTTKDIINNLDNMLYIYNPSKVFLTIGINDIGSGKSKEYIINNLEIIIDNIKENRKYTEIYIESIYPINSNIYYRNNIKNKDIIKINKSIKELCIKKNINYIDIYSSLVDNKNNLKRTLTTDGLHLNDSGYEIISKELERYIKKD